MELEELLNKLIERGWYPFCDNNVKEIRIYSDMDIECIYGKRKSDFYYTSYRKLASKESGLWQFVCKNGMLKKEGEYRAKRRHLHGWEHDEDVYHDISHTKNDYEYRLIESSLKDESELEDFLLSNIKVDG